VGRKSVGRSWLRRQQQARIRSDLRGWLSLKYSVFEGAKSFRKALLGWPIAKDLLELILLRVRQAVIDIFSNQAA
jgi:hypothetical protein